MKRRDFIKRIGLTLGSLALIPTIPFISKAEVSPETYEDKIVIDQTRHLSKTRHTSTSLSQKAWAERLWKEAQKDPYFLNEKFIGTSEDKFFKIV